jgi:hypothetical protein
MTHDQHVYGKIDSEAGMRQVFADIRRDVANADARPALTELYRRAGYLITLTYAPSWQEKFGSRDAGLRKVAEEEFRKTAREINLRAAQIGTEADYHETWGHER